MATLTISLASTPATGSKTYTVSDADVQSLLDWAKATYKPRNGAALTNPQALLAWVDSWIRSTKADVQRFQTPASPPQITIT